MPTCSSRASPANDLAAFKRTVGARWRALTGGTIDCGPIRSLRAAIAYVFDPDELAIPTPPGFSGIRRVSPTRGYYPAPLPQIRARRAAQRAAQTYAAPATPNAEERPR